MRRPLKNRFLKTAALLFLLAIASSASFAHAAGPAYFEALYDVPVMPGLEELPDQSMLFDKPDGRIATVVAGSSSLSPEKVRQFYSETLPQMGWKKTKENQYVRGKDRLELSIERKKTVTLVRFSLSPARPSPVSP
jgi:hypothetical protein